MSKKDILEIEITEDGTIKISADKVSMPNHTSAENFFREVGRLSGGEVSRTRKPNAKHEHTHSHDDHEHQH